MGEFSSTEDSNFQFQRSSEEISSATCLSQNTTKTSDLKWSACSASCGRGVQRKVCEGTTEHCDVTQTRLCFLQFCPSYLSVPRIHFSGSFTADVATINNVRCNYVNSKFSTASMERGFPIPTKKAAGYEVEESSWNPDGSNRFHVNARVTSVCRHLGICSTDDIIVGRDVKETTMTAMVDIDPDWQLATEIYGMKIKLQGVLEGRFKRVAIQQPKPRGSYVMAAMKSVLVDVEWLNDEYKELYKNSTELSIAIVMDEFMRETSEGRITGTIGLTSEDDPLGTTALRRMYPANGWEWKGSIQLYFDAEHKLITLDISSAFNCTRGGAFNLSVFGKLDLAVDVGNHELYCRNHRGAECQLSGENTLRYVTLGGAISKLTSDNNEWYETFGGVLNINLNDVKDDVILLMKSHKLVIIRETTNTKTRKIIFSETEGGINLGFMEKFVGRMNPGEALEMTAFVTSFGKPLEGAELVMDVARNSFADTDCGWDICNRTLGEPRNALKITPSGLSDERGSVVFTIDARDPGNVRGCELDGQLFPMEIRLNHNGMTYVDGGLMRQQRTDQYYDYYLATLPSAIVVYNEVPEIDCPTWEEDIKDIFIRYHNLYPVMWKNRIIDMSSYAGVKQRARMLKDAMFEVDFEDTRYMPITRDLSKSKAKLIKNWMECGMKERNEPDYPSCQEQDLVARLEEMKELLQRAVTLELTIIPPYYTAWLSLQTEIGRNRETAEILRTVFVDEMLHMSLAANLLNSVNGTVNLTKFSNLPTYPTPVGFSETYNLAPNLIIALGPMSRGLVNDVFLSIEEPGDREQRKILGQTAKLLEKISSAPQTSTVKKFMTGHSHMVVVNGTKIVDETSETIDINWKEVNDFTSQAIFSLSTTNITSIGAFYTVIALNIAFLESCHQMAGKGAKTIFRGNLSHQLNISHWHKPEDYYYLGNSELGDVEFPIFEIRDLKTSLQAIVAIISEGEGGTNCRPHLKEGENSIDLPHYHRFMEIVHGRRLKKVREPSSQEMNSCLNFDDDCDEITNVTNEFKYCFTGDLVPFYDDGVWPILLNPRENMYPRGSKVKRVNREFNRLYTRLLKCIETAFGGSPDHVKACMHEMHYMGIVGKKLVQTPVYKDGIKIGHGTPTWVYERGETETTGLPTIQSFDDLY